MEVTSGELVAHCSLVPRLHPLTRKNAGDLRPIPISNCYQRGKKWLLVLFLFFVIKIYVINDKGNMSVADS